MSDDTTKGQVDGAKKPGGKTSPAKGKKEPRKPRPMPDVARMYIEDQTRDQTPMVFVTRDCQRRRKNPHFAGLEIPSFVWLCCDLRSQR